jgi:hypothetical protein
LVHKRRTHCSAAAAGGAKMTPAQIAEAQLISARVEADEIAKLRRQRMIRIAITAEAFEAICRRCRSGRSASRRRRPQVHLARSSDGE